MPLAYRSTLVVHGRLAIPEIRLAAARNKCHGLQVMTFKQAAVRLAGGFARPVDDESLRGAIKAAMPATPMGDSEVRPAVVVDWKSDVMPGTLDRYRAPLRAYLDVTGAERSLIVLMASGAVIPVLPTKSTEIEAA